MGRRTRHFSAHRSEIPSSGIAVSHIWRLRLDPKTRRAGMDREPREAAQSSSRTSPSNRSHRLMRPDVPKLGAGDTGPRGVRIAARIRLPNNTAVSASGTGKTWAISTPSCHVTSFWPPQISAARPAPRWCLWLASMDLNCKRKAPRRRGAFLISPVR